MPRQRKVIVLQDKNEDSSYIRELFGTIYDLTIITNPQVAQNQVEAGETNLLIINGRPDNIDIENYYSGIRKNGRCINLSILIICNSKNESVISQILEHDTDSYMIKPINNSDLLNQAKELLSNQVSSAVIRPERGDNKKVISLTSGKGGTGITTICANWAYTLAKEFYCKTLLIDAASYTNQLSLLLNVEPKKNLADVCREHETVSAKNIKECIKEVIPNLHIANLLNRIQDVDHLKLSTLETLIDYAYNEYDYILIDTQSGILNPITNTLINRSDDLHVITTFEPLALKEANAYINVLKDFGISPGKIKLILNRADSEIGKSDIRQIKQYLFYEIFCTLPNDWASCIEAASKQIPVVEYAKRSKFSQELKVLSGYYITLNRGEALNK